MNEDSFPYLKGNNSYKNNIEKRIILESSRKSANVHFITGK
jgi:hypothetical protein